MQVRPGALGRAARVTRWARHDVIRGVAPLTDNRDAFTRFLIQCRAFGTGHGGLLVLAGRVLCPGGEWGEEEQDGENEALHERNLHKRS